MARSPETFPRVYVAMVEAARTGGFLDVVLAQIADFQAREKEIKSKAMGALMYPVILLILAIGVLIFLMVFFIPRFQMVFQELQCGPAPADEDDRGDEPGGARLRPVLCRDCRGGRSHAEELVQVPQGPPGLGRLYPEGAGRRSPGGAFAMAASPGCWGPCSERACR